MILKYTLVWLLMPFIGILNGTIREFGYKKYMSELLAHQVSCLTGIFLFGLFVWALSLKWKIQSTNQALIIGLIWFVLTILFEFVFGYYVMEHPWSRLFNDYNLLAGRLWIIVLLFTSLAPYIFFKFRSQLN